MLCASRAIAWCALTLCVCAAPAAAGDEGWIGIEPTVFVGKHFETENNVSGTAAGLFLEGGFRTERFGVHVESIPNIDARATTSSPFGKLTQSISIFTVDGRWYIDGPARTYVSIGEAVFTQSTPIFLPPSRVQYTDSRVVGARLGIGTRLGSSRGFAEASVTASPSLHGAISYRLATNVKPPSQSETASEVDASLGVGRRFGTFEVVTGIRNINYAANLVGGVSADRNVATGLFVEGRYLFGRH